MAQGSAYGIPIDTDGTLAANSDQLVATQKATKTYVDTQVSANAFTDEKAQDAVGGILVDSTTIDLTYSDGTPSITAAAIVQMSITSDASGLKLSGDATSPGALQGYGTNSSGTKGWYGESVVFAYTDTVNSTNTTSEEALWNVTIPANTLAVGDTIDIVVVTRKTSGTGSNTFRVRYDSASGVTGSVITSYAGTSTQSMVARPCILVTGASAQKAFPGFNGITYGVAAVDSISTAFAIANPIYINVTNTKVTGTDGFELRFASVIIHKKRA